MSSTLNIRDVPDSVCRKAALLAADRGASIKQVVVDAIDAAWRASALAKALPDTKAPKP